jgi:hypothetical protein
MRANSSSEQRKSPTRGRNKTCTGSPAAKDRLTRQTVAWSEAAFAEGSAQLNAIGSAVARG